MDRNRISSPEKNIDRENEIIYADDVEVEAENNSLERDKVASMSEREWRTQEELDSRSFGSKVLCCRDKCHRRHRYKLKGCGWCCCCCCLIVYPMYMSWLGWRIGVFGTHGCSNFLGWYFRFFSLGFGEEIGLKRANSCEVLEGGAPLVAYDLNNDLNPNIVQLEGWSFEKRARSA